MIKPGNIYLFLDQSQQKPFIVIYVSKKKSGRVHGIDLETGVVYSYYKDNMPPMQRQKALEKTIQKTIGCYRCKDMEIMQYV